MAGKKKAKKKAKQRKSGKGEPQLLGAGSVGTALLGAIAGEIAQAVVSRMARSTEEDSKVGEIRGSVKDAAVAVKGAVEQVQPSVQTAIDTVKAVADDVQPAVTKVANVLHDRADSTKETIGDAVGDSTGAVVGVTEKASGKIKNALKVVKPGKKKKR